MNEAEVDEVHRLVLELTDSARYDEALELCRDATSRWDATFVHHAWHNMAYVLWRSARRSEAVEAISLAIELAPEDRAHRFTRAMWMTEEEDFEAARVDWTELIRLENAAGSEAFLGTALLGRAIINLRLGELATAREDLERIDGDDLIVIGGCLWTADILKQLASTGGK